MDLHQLRCFLAAADELHFGRAAQQMQMLPAALGRHIRLLEESLGRPLFVRTTRTVSLTDDGAALVSDARVVLAQVAAIEARFRDRRGGGFKRRFKIGTIDSAAAGLIPPLLADLRVTHPDFAVQVFEDKTIRLLPKILSGALDLAFVRPPERPDRRLQFRALFEESAVVAFADGHKLARRKSVSLVDIAEEPLIVPDRRSRPHSHDLTVKLFAASGITPKIAEVADEKQTIVNLVAAKLGAAIVPRWTARMAIPGIRFVPLNVAGATDVGKLPLAAMWLKGTRDSVRDAVLDIVVLRMKVYSAGA